MSYTLLASATAFSDAAKADKYVTSTKTTSFTAAPGNVYLVDTTSGVVTATLPAASVAGQSLVVKRVAGTNVVTVVRAGSDTIGAAATTADITLDNESWELVSSGSGQWNLTAGNKSLASLDGRFANLTDYRIVSTIRPLISGQWRTVLGSSQGTGTHAAGTERAQLILLPPGTSLQAVAVSVVTLAASSVVRLGIRADASGRPGTLIADWGTVDSTTTGTKTLAISYTVPAGTSRLWLVAAAQGGNPVLTTRATGGVDIDGLTAAEAVGNGATPGSVTQTGVTGALPNSFTFSASLNAATLIAVQAA